MMATSPGASHGDASLPLVRVGAHVLAAERAQLLERHHLRVAEAAQALHVEHDDLAQPRRALAHGQDLVELLLVLHEQDLGVAVVDRYSTCAGESVG